MGDFVEDVVGVVDEEVDDLGEEALLLHRPQVLESLVHNTLDDHTRGKIRQSGPVIPDHKQAHGD